MASANNSTKTKFLQKLLTYRKTYLSKKYETLDESATRLMINYFLTEVLGYIQIEDVKTEYAIKGTYADYVIQLNRKKPMVVEVKSIALDLNENHLRQALGYAANEGVDWILLTNGRQIELYRVLFTKPINVKKTLSINLADINEIKANVDYIYLLSKKAVLAKELENYWTRFTALEPINLAKLLYSEEIIKNLRKQLKSKTGIAFTEEDIVNSIYDIIVLKIESNKPKAKTTKKITAEKTKAEA